jgi:hypothetical protein
VDDVVSGKLKKIKLRRTPSIGASSCSDVTARKLAEVLSKRPWHNVAYFTGPYAALAAAVRTN